LALLKDGTVMAWGANGRGQLGDGTTAWSIVPVPVEGLSEAVAVAAGGEQSLALLKDGTLMAWGANGRGQLGDGTNSGPESCNEPSPGGEYTFACSLTPVAVSGIGEATGIAVGSDNLGGPEGWSLALLKDGSVMAWGTDERGQLGDGGIAASTSACSCATTPVMVSGIDEVTTVSAGENFSLARLKDGSVMSWGTNDYGQLGDGAQASFELDGHTTIGSDIPVAVSGLSQATAIAAGGRT